jgi:hypothetical protein
LVGWGICADAEQAYKTIAPFFAVKLEDALALFRAAHGFGAHLPQTAFDG